MTEVSWPTLLIGLGLVIVVLGVWTLQQQKNDYDWKDLIMEGEPRKASLNKHIILGCFLISVWLIVMRTMDVGAQIPTTVDNLLAIVLGAFILKQIGNQGVDRFSRRPQSQSIVNDAQNVTIEPPPRR